MPSSEQLYKVITEPTQSQETLLYYWFRLVNYKQKKRVIKRPSNPFFQVKK